MRLIDADILIHLVTDSTILGDGFKTAFCALVNGEPTVKVQKTGKWIIKDNPGTGWYRVTCSECGEDVTSTAPCIGFYPKAKVTWDFCPYCGTRMVGKEE